MGIVPKNIDRNRTKGICNILQTHKLAPSVVIMVLIFIVFTHQKPGSKVKQKVWSDSIACSCVNSINGFVIRDETWYFAFISPRCKIPQHALLSNFLAFGCWRSASSA
jgi:hypothetical protein